MVELEQTAEVRCLAAAMATRQTPDFEAWDSLLPHWQQHVPREIIRCQCGQRMSSRGWRAKGLLTTLGRVPFGRSTNASNVTRAASLMTSGWTKRSIPSAISIRPAFDHHRANWLEPGSQSTQGLAEFAGSRPHLPAPEQSGQWWGRLTRGRGGCYSGRWMPLIPRRISAMCAASA
jgi:hypothetical protein